MIKLYFTLTSQIDERQLDSVLKYPFIFRVIMLNLVKALKLQISLNFPDVICYSCGLAEPVQHKQLPWGFAVIEGNSGVQTCASGPGASHWSTPLLHLMFPAGFGDWFRVKTQEMGGLNRAPRAWGLPEGELQGRVEGRRPISRASAQVEEPISGEGFTVGRRQEVHIHCRAKWKPCMLWLLYAAVMCLSGRGQQVKWQWYMGV